MKSKTDSIHKSISKFTYSKNSTLCTTLACRSRWWQWKEASIARTTIVIVDSKLKHKFPLWKLKLRDIIKHTWWLVLHQTLFNLNARKKEFRHAPALPFPMQHLRQEAASHENNYKLSLKSHYVHGYNKSI